MSNEEPAEAGSHIYTQHGDIEMIQRGDSVYPNFRFEDNRGMSEASSEELGYPLGPVPKGEDVEYAFHGEPDGKPEMDFRR